MATDQLKVKFVCKKCGGTVIELPDDHTDNSIAKCKKCGTNFGRWGDIKAQATRKALDHATDRVKAAFKGIKGFRPK